MAELVVKDNVMMFMQIRVINMVKSVQLKTVRVCLRTMMVEPAVGSKVMVSVVVSFSVCSPYDQNESLSFHPQLPKKTPTDPLESRCSCFRDNCDTEVARYVSSVFCCCYGFDYDPCTGDDFDCLSVCLHDNCDTEIARFVRSIVCYCYGFDYDPCTGDNFHCLSAACHSPIPQSVRMCVLRQMNE